MNAPTAAAQPLAERDTGDSEIRQDFVAITSMGIMVASYVGFLRGLSDIRQYRIPLLIFATLFAAFFACYRLRGRSELLVGAAYLLMPAISVFVLLRYTEMEQLAFVAALGAVAAFQISRRLGLGSLVLNTGALALGLPQGETLFVSLGVLWSAAAIEYASTSGRMTVLQWAWSSQNRARQLLDEVRASQGELNRTLAALTEATRRLQRTNAELKIARQDAEEARSAKEQFVANVSHELRTPLNLILGFAEMMYLHPETYEGVQWASDLENDVREIYRASRHLQELVNDVLDLSRIDAMRLPMFREMQPIEPIVHEVIETVLPLFRQRNIALDVVTEKAGNDVAVFVDRTRIRQVLINLLSNALRYTDEGMVSVSICTSEDQVLISVRDTGVGIPEDKLAEIFEEFRQADPSPRGRGGAGLGLALSRRFVELHGGDMWAESNVGVGTTVKFSIPLPGTLPSPQSLARSANGAKADKASGPILIVDADPTIGDMLRRYLSDRPVIWVSTIADAAALVEEAHPTGIVVNEPPEAPFESWFEDWPESVRRYNIPMVHCSMASPSWLRSPGGLQDCLTKPVSTKDLARALRVYCPEPGTILVVDDDPGFVVLMERMFGIIAPEYRVVPAHSGSQALRLARTVRPDIVFLDLAMPEMDGFALLDELRRDAEVGTVPVVAVTASSYAEEALRQRGAHFLLSQFGGLGADALLPMLETALESTHPDYV